MVLVRQSFWSQRGGLRSGRIRVRDPERLRPRPQNTGDPGSPRQDDLVQHFLTSGSQRLGTL